MLVGQHHLGALASPLHRPVELARRPQRQPVLDILPALGAEAAADVVAHHAHLALRHLEHHVGEHVAHAVRIVHVGVQRVAILRRIVDADRAARLHVLRVHAGDDVAALDDMRRPGEGRLGRRAVAALGGVRDVVGVFVPQARRVRLRRFARPTSPTAAARNPPRPVRRHPSPAPASRRSPSRPDRRHSARDRPPAPDAAARTSASRRASCAASPPSAWRCRRSHSRCRCRPRPRPARAPPPRYRSSGSARARAASGRTRTRSADAASGRPGSGPCRSAAARPRRGGSAGRRRTSSLAESRRTRSSGRPDGRVRPARDVEIPPQTNRHEIEPSGP